jgi:hypothetical protein
LTGGDVTALFRTPPRRRALISLALLAGLAATLPAAQAQDLTHSASVASEQTESERGNGPCRRDIGTESFYRTELFFGLSRPRGVVTEEEFKAFIDGDITPRFPYGLTLLSGTAQFREASGSIVVEGSKLLILLYPRSDSGAKRRVEQIRADCKRLFQQQSVLRTDELSCVSF